LLGNTWLPQPTPIEQWGQGRLNVWAAVAAMKAGGDDPPPAAPTGLRVTSVHSQSVSLAWDPAPDLDLRRYQVFRQDETGVMTPLFPTLPPTVTTFEDLPDENNPSAALSNEKVYVYSIRAVDIGDQESPPSDEVSAVPTVGDGSVGFCFIATAAYGSAWHPHVASLRAFRDRYLRPHPIGRAAVAAYEAISPPLARLIAPHPALRAVTRGALTPIVLVIEHPRASAALLGLSLLLGVIGLGLRRRLP
jgi:hypothetical protein